MAGLRIMTFNLRRDVESDGAHRWSARREILVAAIQRAAPDVLGTQEGLPHQLREIDQALPRYARVSRCRHGDETDESTAIYYARDRFACIEEGTFWLSETPDVPASRSWGSRHPRIVTWVKLRDLAAGKDVTIANTHLDHESYEARERAAALLAQRLPGAILMGDLNAAPGERTHAILLRAGWDDAGAHEPTYHAFTGRATARIDHILAPPTHRIVSVRVVAEARDGIHASDHHAVVADLEAK